MPWIITVPGNSTAWLYILTSVLYHVKNRQSGRQGVARRRDEPAVVGEHYTVSNNNEPPPGTMSTLGHHMVGPCSHAGGAKQCPARFIFELPPPVLLYSFSIWNTLRRLHYLKVSVCVVKLFSCDPLLHRIQISSITIRTTTRILHLQFWRTA